MRIIYFIFSYLLRFCPVLIWSLNGESRACWFEGLLIGPLVFEIGIFRKLCPWTGGTNFFQRDFLKSWSKMGKRGAIQVIRNGLIQ